MSGALGLIEMLLFFGLVMGFALREWLQWRRWDRRQRELERSIQAPDHAD